MKRSTFVSLFTIFLFMILIASCSNLSPMKGEGKKIRYFTSAWQKNLDPDYETGNLPISFHSPNIRDGILYMGSADGTMRAYNATNGRPVWEAKEKRGISNQATFFERMVIYGTAEGLMVSRDSLTGELLYAIELGDALESPVTFAQGRAFVHLRDHRVVALDAVTGKILWTYKRSIAQGTTIQEAFPPTEYNGKLMVGFADGHIVAFNIDDGSILWEQNLAEDAKFVDVNMRPLFKDNLMYVGSQGGPFSILNSKNGDILKRFSFRCSHSPLFLENGKMAFGTQDGDLITMDKDGNNLQTQNVGSPIFGMNLWLGKLVVATRKGQLFLFDLENLKEIERFSFGHYYSLVFGDLVVEGDLLSVLSSRNKLYVFRPH